MSMQKWPQSHFPLKVTNSIGKYAKAQTETVVRLLVHIINNNCTHVTQLQEEKSDTN